MLKMSFFINSKCIVVVTSLLILEVVLSNNKIIIKVDGQENHYGSRKLKFMNNDWLLLSLSVNKKPTSAGNSPYKVGIYSCCKKKQLTQHKICQFSKYRI